MKIVLTRNDKIRIIISLAVIAIGLLAIAYVFSPYSHALKCPEFSPGNENCGEDGTAAGFVLVIAGLVAIIGVIGLVASLLLKLISTRLKKPKFAFLVTVLLVAAGLWVIGFIQGAPGRREESQKADITTSLKQQQASFVAYHSAPKFSDISVHSSAITTKPVTGLTTYITLDLHACSPGTGQASYASGTTYFAISGVRRDKLGGSNDYECVFYMDAVATDQKWDGLLHLQCVWPINPIMNDDAQENRRGMSVKDSGVDFRDFALLYCVDLRTGAASASPAFNNH